MNSADFTTNSLNLRTIPHPGARVLLETIGELSEDELQKRHQAAELALMNMGITFNVYGSEAGVEKIFPFDIIPRIVSHTDWTYIEKGLEQRIQALNLFICDIYTDQKILKDGIIPRHVIDTAKEFLKPCIGLSPSRNVWCHISGIDLVRDTDGQFYILEGQPALSFGRVLCARKSGSSQTHIPRSIRGLSCATRR